MRIVASAEKRLRVLDQVSPALASGRGLKHCVMLYAAMELVRNVDGTEAHLILNIPDYYGDMTQRELAIELADYLAKRLVDLRAEEASNARVLYELVKNQRLG